MALPLLSNSRLPLLSWSWFPLGGTTNVASVTETGPKIVLIVALHVSLRCALSWLW